MFGLKTLARMKEVRDYVDGQTYAWNRCMDVYSEYVVIDIMGMFPELEDMAEVFVLNDIKTIPFEMPAKHSMKFVEGVSAYMSEMYGRMDSVSAG